MGEKGLFPMFQLSAKFVQTNLGALTTGRAKEFLCTEADMF